MSDDTKLENYILHLSRLSFHDLDLWAFDLLHLPTFPPGHETGKHGDTASQTDEGAGSP